MIRLRPHTLSRHLPAAAALTLLCLPVVAPAQLPDTGAAAATCKAALVQPLPPAPTGGPLPAAALPTCDERALYYGLGRPADPAAALECGWYERAHPQPSIGNMFYGPGVLSMVYANGDGVPRNLDLATRFVCENPWSAPAELDGRLEHLAHIRQAVANHTTPKDLHFDLCDDATSGLSEGSCTAITTRRAAATRDTKIAALVRTLPTAAQHAFPALEAAEQTFSTTRAENEIDLSGTGRAAFSLEEEKILADQFLINLQRFGCHDIPATSPAQLAVLRQQLSTTFDRTQHAPATQWQYTTLTPAGIATTEQAYLALIAAWRSFAALAYPTLPPDAVEAELLRLRLHQLRSLL